MHKVKELSLEFVNKNFYNIGKGIYIKEYVGYFYYYCQIRKNYKTYNKRFPYNSEGLTQATIWLKEQREQLHGEFSRSK